MIESGEVFIRLVNQSFGDSRVPFGLEIIEADLLDDDYTGIEKNGNRVRMGVEVDEWSRPCGLSLPQLPPRRLSVHQQQPQRQATDKESLPTRSFISTQ